MQPKKSTIKGLQMSVIKFITPLFYVNVLLKLFNSSYFSLRVWSIIGHIHRIKSLYYNGIK